MTVKLEEAYTKTQRAGGLNHNDAQWELAWIDDGCRWGQGMPVSVVLAALAKILNLIQVSWNPWRFSSIPKLSVGILQIAEQKVVFQVIFCKVNFSFPNINDSILKKKGWKWLSLLRNGLRLIPILQHAKYYSTTWKVKNPLQTPCSSLGVLAQFSPWFTSTSPSSHTTRIFPIPFQLHTSLVNVSSRHGMFKNPLPSKYCKIILPEQSI